MRWVRDNEILGLAFGHVDVLEHDFVKFTAYLNAIFRKLFRKAAAIAVVNLPASKNWIRNFTN